MIKKVLVAGGAGFIGSHLCEKLLNSGMYEEFSLDNYFTGNENNDIKGVNYIRGNTSEIDNLISLKPSLIYHLGEYSGVEQSFDDIEKVWRFNKDEIFAVLEFCRKTGAKIVYAGSSTKFGDGGLGRNQSPFAWAKASNTELVFNNGEWFNISYEIIYFYNVYGNRQILSSHMAAVIGIFEDCLKKNKPLTVVSPGTQSRRFTHVNDTVKVCYMAYKKNKNTHYSISSKKQYRIIDLAKLFSKNIKYVPERKGERFESRVINEIRGKKIENLTSRISIEKYVKSIKKNIQFVKNL